MNRGVLRKVGCLLFAMSMFSISSYSHAYGKVSRAGCGYLNVLESITYTVFPSESDDYLYTQSYWWKRQNGQNWINLGQHDDGWDTIHTRAGSFFAYTNAYAGYVIGDHWSWDGAVRYQGRTTAGDCNLTNWY